MRVLSINASPEKELAIYDEIQGLPESQYQLRLFVVLMVIKKFECKQIASLFSLHPTTIQRWVNEFNRHGIEGLRSKPRSGRPKSLTESQWKKLRNDLGKSTFEFYYTQLSWDSKLLRLHLSKEYQVKLSIRQCQRILKNMGGKKGELFRTAQNLLLETSMEMQY